MFPYPTITLAALLFSAAHPAAQDPQPTDPAAANPAKPPQTAPRDYDLDPFALGLLAKAAPAGNACVSPLSIALALAQLRAGAAGETAAELDAALGAHAKDPVAQVAGLARAIAPRKVRGTGREMVDGYQLALANAAFVSDQLGLRDAYAATLRSRFASAPRALDFRNDAAGARKLINDWVAEQTKQRILDLLPTSTPAPSTQVILVSCVHLHALWAKPFQEGATMPAPFHLGDREIAQVATMHRVGSAGYLANADATVVRLATKDPSLGMLFLLPPPGQTLADLEARLPALWPSLHAPPNANLSLSLPRFRVETELRLRGPLQALGVRRTFTPQAELQGMVGRADTMVDDVVHKTYLDVQEAGFEAAAATAVVARAGSPRAPQEVPIDRPFLFAIYHDQAGALFVGRIVDPR